MAIAAYSVSPEALFAPQGWALASCAIWLAYLSRRAAPLGLWDKRQLAWGLSSAVCFLYYLQFDQTFQVGGRRSRACCFGPLQRAARRARPDPGATPRGSAP
jgi:hypothetical protein